MFFTGEKDNLLPPYEAQPLRRLQANSKAETVSIPQQKAKKYTTSVPLNQLSIYPAPADCPICGQRALTKTKHVIGGYTHALAFAVFCGSGVLFWLPYVVKGAKNVQHYCGNPDCGVLMVLWHRSPHPGGAAEVFEFA